MLYLVKLAKFGQKFLKNYGKIISLVLLLMALSTPQILRAEDPPMTIPTAPTTTVPGGDSVQAALDKTNADAAAKMAADAGSNVPPTTIAPSAASYLADEGLTQTAVNGVILLLGTVFTYLAQGVGWIILTLIKIILIPILHYDGFATSRIIGLGWSLVRDVVNMFVVVVLLVIAVMTIVGSPKANWEQQIPRLFIYVIAVNFSRTICGLLLDVGNVVMFQFVNAILDVGAGNFAQLLKLNITGTFTDHLNTTIGAAQLLAGAYMQLALLLAVLAVIGIMVLVFLYRIVVLWVLIIMSPAAFFAGGIKDVLGQAGSAYNDWWKKFSSAIILGPLLTFFLWLALAAASSGDIISSENFPTGGASENIPGIVLQQFDMSQLAGLMLGLVLLVVGMQQASHAAGALGPIAAGLVSEGMGMRIVKGAMRMPAQQLGRQLDKRLAPAGSTLTSEIGKGVIGLGQAARSTDIPILGKVFGATVGKGLSIAGSAIQGVGDTQLHDSQHAAEERVKAWSPERLASELALVASGEKPFLLSSGGSQAAAVKKFVTDKGVQDMVADKMIKADKINGPQQFQDLMRTTIAQVEHHEKHIIGDDDKAGQAFNATKSRNVHLIGAMADDRGEMHTAAERQRAHMDNPKFKPGDMGTDAIKSEGIQNIARSLVTGTDKSGNSITMWDDIIAARGGVNNKLRDAAMGTPNRTTFAKDDQSVVQWAPGQRAAVLNSTSVTQQDIQTNITGGALEINSITHADWANDKGPNPGHRGDEIAKSIALSGADFTLPHNQVDKNVLDDFETNIKRVIGDENNNTKEEIVKAIAAKFAQTTALNRGTYDLFIAGRGGNDAAALAEVVKTDPAAIRFVDPNKGRNATEKAFIEDAIEHAVNDTMLDTLVGRMKKMTKDDKNYNNYRDALRKINKTLQSIDQRTEEYTDKKGVKQTRKIDKGGGFDKKRNKVAETVLELES